MRFRMMAALVAASLPLSAVVAQSQEESGAEDGSYLEGLAADEGTRDLGGAFDPSDVEGEAGGADARPSSHRVEKGDTLWDLSQRYLGNPWHWPRVWSFNPEIENPHWIFPGENVRLGPESAAAVEPQEAFHEEDLAEEPDVAVIGRIGFHQERGGRRVPNRGFVTPRALQESATIEKSWEEKSLLAAGDRVYLDWPEDRRAEVGQTYVVYRTEDRIHHPITDAFLGHFTKILGTVRVVEASPLTKNVTAMIVKSFEEIERGDRIGPSFGDFGRSVVRAPNARNLLGRIAATQERGVGEVGQDHLVFLDRGRADGVVPGNVFFALRAGDGLEAHELPPAEGSTLPAERLGELLVVDVQERSSTAVVLESRRELRVGDRVVMLAAPR